MAAPLADFLYRDEAQCVDTLLESLPWDDERAARVYNQARDFVQQVRHSKRKIGELEVFLQQYGLDTEEGLALMTLAEALLRIPDAPTADALIRDKMVAADWLSKQGSSKDILVKAAGFGLSLTRKTLDSAAARLGEPVIRKAMVETMRMMGRQFVLGRTIEEAIKNGKDYQKKGYRLSYDMLGEGARTMEDAERYYESYYNAISHIASSGREDLPPGISVKLSALHPRYEYSQKDRCVPALTEKLTALSLLAAEKNVALTVDAEEADRLDLSLDIIGNVMGEKKLNGWEGFGLAVQAYQKRCWPLIDEIVDMAQSKDRKIQVRLVKGAYWDTEVKLAQVMGLPDYPVFTRKANTDLSYIACARMLLHNRDYIYPMLATHNAHTMAAILDLAGNNRNGFEFQRLHGMGETLHDLVLQEGVAPTCVYAPVGSHEDLLPYLVRRLLENGANSSFVNKLLDKDTPIEEIIADPVYDAREHELKRHPKIPLPRDIYGAGRANSKGIDLAEESEVEPLMRKLESLRGRQYEAAPLIAGKPQKQGEKSDVTNPADNGDIVGHVWQADEKLIDQAFAVAKGGFEKWSYTPAAERAAALDKLGDLMEENMAELMSICIREAGKTIDDAVAEVREAVDFCRYYAMRGRVDFADEGHKLPGPTGESNIFKLQGRGIFICVSPWNFPLAIFTGQVTAALMAGNAVIAKPASPTPLIAAKAVELMIEAGIAPEAITLLPGSGRMGQKMIEHPDVAGVAFTGSTGVAWQINRTLAAKDGPIARLIAETGGQNAMVIDSSALTEQVIDDVLVSAFGSAGQRCSALRVLYVQDDVADKTIAMLKGAMAQQRAGNPAALASDIGPIINDGARADLLKHREWLDKHGTFIAEIPVDEALKKQGSFMVPVAYEIGGIGELDGEHFGPILHVVRYKAKDLDNVIAAINGTGFGLTLGVHSRISSTTNHITRRVRVGNAYVNRTMIGAVVGVQPFGGQGLSGTGPKAGGPHYMPAFATEKVVSTDTTRQGGNASLVSLQE